MGVVYCHASRINQSIIQRMNDVQKQFKNAFGIVIGLEDDEQWSTMQLMIDYNNMKLFRVTDSHQAAQFTLQCYQEMSQKEKFSMQARYFDAERQRLVSAEQSCKITQEAFDRLEVPRDDAQIVMDGFPSICQIVSTPRAVLAENSPASFSSIEKIATFFER